MFATIIAILSVIVLRIGPLVLAGYIVYVNDWSFWWYLPVLFVLIIGTVVLTLLLGALMEMIGKLLGFNKNS